MNERYIRIFTLEPKHEQGEVSVVAGALLYDREKDRKLAQIKLQSNETRKISRVVVLVSAFDSEGTLLGEPIRFEYRDPEVDENGCFGTRNPIDLPTAVSSFSASVERVLFENRESEQSEYYNSEIPKKKKTCVYRPNRVLQVLTSVFLLLYFVVLGWQNVFFDEMFVFLLLGVMIWIPCLYRWMWIPSALLALRTVSVFFEVEFFTSYGLLIFIIDLYGILLLLNTLLFLLPKRSKIKICIHVLWFLPFAAVIGGTGCYIWLFNIDVSWGYFLVAKALFLLFLGLLLYRTLVQDIKTPERGEEEKAERKGKGLSILLFSLAGLFLAGGIALGVVWYLWTTYDFTAFSTVRLLGILAALSLSIGLICLSIQLSRKLSKMKKILCLGIGSVSSLAIGIVLCLVLNGMSMSLFYQRAEKFYSCGEYHRAMGAFDQLPDDYRDSQARAQECRSKNP